MANIEFWLARPTHYWMLPSEPIDGTFSFARGYEDAGCDGLLFFDTQNLALEALVSLAAAAKETTTLGLGTGVTNPHDVDRAGEASRSGRRMALFGPAYPSGEPRYKLRSAVRSEVAQYLRDGGQPDHHGGDLSPCWPQRHPSPKPLDRASLYELAMRTRSGRESVSY